MKTTLDCIPCFVRQTLDVARLASPDPLVQEGLLRDVLRWTSEMDLGQSPPVMGQRIHRRLRMMAGCRDLYGGAKARFTQLALKLAPAWEIKIREAEDPLELAVRLAIAANIIDLGAKTGLSESDLPSVFEGAIQQPLVGDMACFRQAVAQSKRILFLADNAGEIVFDRLLIQQLSPQRVTVAVRGAPVINDATMADAEAAGLCEVVKVISNGSDAPGTILEDCSEEFRREFEAADLIIAKGQGNFETLAGNPRTMYFLFKVKCPVVATHSGFPLGAHVLLRSGAVGENDVPPSVSAAAGGAV